MSNEIQHKRIQLDNGLKVVGEIHPYGNAVSLGFALKIGSRDEQESELQGACHLLEHLCFKSTEKYNSFELVNKWESRGGDLNAFTAKEYTCFHAYGLKEDLEMGLDLLTQIVFYNNWSEKDLQAEQSVVSQEILVSHDNPEDFLFDDFTSKYFAGGPMAHPIFGSIESVRDMDIEKLRDFQALYYRPENCVLAVAGNFDWDELIRQLPQFLPKGESSFKDDRIYPPLRGNSFLHFEKRKSHHNHFLMSYPSHSLREGRFFESSILTNHLSGGMNSLLFQKIREDLALCYQISASYGPSQQAGMFSLYSSTQEDKMVPLVQECLNLLKEIKEKSLTQQEIDASAEQIRCGLLLGETDIDSRMNSLIYDEIFSREYLNVEALIEGLQKVDLNSMEEYLQNYFELERSSFYFFGDISKSTQKLLESVCSPFLVLD
ncbi:MAG: pitrilysin family protein [Bdellovibrionota bacterium]|nr:pitrilysin family protein [Bdellovibrionota bacterium]